MFVGTGVVWYNKYRNQTKRCKTNDNQEKTHCWADDRCDYVYKRRSFAGALEDGRSNLPKSFTEGSAISACINSDIVVVLKADHTLWASGKDIDNIYPAFTQIASDVKSCFYDGGRIGIIKIDDSFWTADLSTFKSDADFVKQMTDVKFAIVKERNILVLKKTTLFGAGVLI